MKNMKISAKLMISFIAVIIMSILVGGVGILGMMQINNASGTMYDMQTVPMPYMTTIVEMIQRQRAVMREYIIAAATEDWDLLEDAHDRQDQYDSRLQEYLPLYRATILTTTDAGVRAMALFTEAEKLYNDSFLFACELIYERAKEGVDAADLYALMGQYTADINKVVENLDECLELKVAAAAANNDANDQLFTTMLILILAIIALAITVSLFFAIYISRAISKPILPITAFMSKAGTTGNLQLSAADRKTMDFYGQYKDETGQLINGASAFVNRILEIEGLLQKLSQGDFSLDIRLLSNEDSMGISVEKLIGSMNSMFGEINSSSSQVDSGAKQIADGAQALSQGSTEQAASIEQLSSSISEIATQTKSNAEMAEKAASLSNDIRGNAEKGNRQMDEMMEAVRDINIASQNISKVIKVIDDIAFQTNILALNAAVEAARAGQHGKGFAVVAEEVRNLAAKSAEAAKETGDMIQNSMEKAELGSRIASETAVSFTEISEGIAESTRLVAEIAQSSKEQAMGISQVNIGIDQVAQVVQQNSATAQESAAASEEMSGQSAMLQELIGQFRLR
ncbi:MAG: methyl-accepting chemotaxis protein [Oscillospiraceae bacterium]|nr:methyl-accepting chemotaxis protein [Oscillospiraceae bacterium]